MPKPRRASSAKCCVPASPIDSSDILNSELIRRLSEQRVTLRAQLAEQSATLLGNHPRIKELKAQIGDLDQQIRAEAETVVRSLENDAKIAGARLDSQTSSLDQLKRQAASTNEQDVQLRALERDAKSQRDLLESYLAKYREATARDTINSAPADARVISRATVSNMPAYPKKLPTVLIATLAMMVLSSGMVLTRELLGGAVYSAPRRIAQPRVSRAGQHRDRCRDASVSAKCRPPSACRSARSRTSLTACAMAAKPGEAIAVLGAKSGIGTGLAAITLGAGARQDGARRARGSRIRRGRNQSHVERSVGTWARRTGARRGLVRQYHHQGQAVVPAPDLFRPLARGRRRNP